MSSKLRHRGIDGVHVGVKLLNEHDRTPFGLPTERLLSPSLNDFR